jgi:hypothetical protein
MKPKTFSFNVLLCAVFAALVLAQEARSQSTSVWPRGKATIQQGREQS